MEYGDSFFAGSGVSGKGGGTGGEGGKRIRAA